MGWVTADAPTRAELDACITCGLCLPVCPTFRLTGEESASPRGRLAAMAAVAEGIIEVDDVFAEVMGFCLQCRACEVACPSLVPFGRAMEGARAEIAVQLPDRTRSMRHTLLSRGLSWRTGLRAATAGAGIAQRLRIQGVMPGPLSRMTGLRPLSVNAPSIVGTTLLPVGEPIGRAAVLAGCVMDPWFGPVHQATLELLRMAGYEVEVPESQTCCGALAAHDGAAEAARVLASRNVAAFEGYDVVVADAAGCTAHLKEYQHWSDDGRELAERVRDVTEIVADLIRDGRLPSSDRELGEVAVQDPCHLRHAQRIVDEPREVLRAAGYAPVEIDPDGFCCGAAGVYMALHPATSDLLGMQKADQVRAAGPSLVASANPGCEMQLRTHLGPGFRVAHPVELYWESVRPEGGDG